MRNRRSLTDGVGVLGTIYDRLRKRDAARMQVSSRHTAYVAGVRDALHTVALAMGNPPKERKVGVYWHRRARRQAEATDG